MVDPRRDLDLDRSLLDDAAGAAALAARLLDPAARASAGRARLGADELAEDAPRHLLQPSGSVARRAGDDLGARFRAVAATASAGHRRLERHLARNAVSRLDEVDLDRRSQVGPAPTTASGTAAEEDVVAEEGREEVGEVAEVDVIRLARELHPDVSDAPDDLAEPLMGVGRVGHVGMELARK